MAKTSGAQPGNRNSAKGKVWRDALDKAIKQYTNKDAGIKRGQALFRIATTVVEQAIAGNKDAIQEIGNRLDGRPHQSMDIGTYETTKPQEEMTDAELCAELEAIRVAIARNAGKASGEGEPPPVH